MAGLAGLTTLAGFFAWTFLCWAAIVEELADLAWRRLRLFRAQALREMRELRRLAESFPDPAPLDAADALDDTRAQSAIAWLLARQDERGRWGGRAPYAARMPSRIDASKWVTLHALTLLKHAFPGPTD